MTQKIEIVNKEWEKEENRLKYCPELEKGNILFFDDIPFPFPQEEIDFLLGQKQGSSKTRKNIAYKPDIDKITNHEESNPEIKDKMHGILRNYSKRVTEFLSTLLAPLLKRLEARLC